uniref:Phospholipid transfer protein n=1 Tax=Propithecus coquereli TaxID=379532 RepID=A0A2K6F492_PROCO
MALFRALFLALLAGAHAELPGCKIRVTSKALELVKQEGLRFLEQELENISIPDLRGREGHFYYNISEVKVTELQLTSSELHFRPEQELTLQITNASLGLRLRRQLLYWFFYDGGYINASAEGVFIRTALELSRDPTGRMKVSNVSCQASVSRIHAAFGGTFKKVYDFLSTFITSGMRFLLNQQICPVLYHAGMVLLNSLLDTVPVRSSVDELVGIDYSLLKDPVASSNLDMDFRGAFFPLAEGNWSLPNQAVEPQLQEEERMVYVAFSEFFFDTAMESYFRAGALRLSLVGDKVPHDLDMLLRASYFGSIVLLSPAVIDSPLKLELRVTAPPRCTIKPSGTTISVTASVTIAMVPPNQPEVQLSSMIMDARLSAKMALRGKVLRTQLDLRRFRIYSNQSALESLAPRQAPPTCRPAMLQIGVMPLLNERTWHGVQIPLPEGIDFVREVVTNHVGFLTIGADLHFAKGLREVIEKNRPANARDVQATSAPPASTPASTAAV